MKTRALWSVMLLILAATTARPAWAGKPELKCRADGTFKIVMFSDIQDDETLDPRATALMEKILDTEKPDFVVIGGDCIAGGACDTVDQVKQALSQVAYPMEKRKIPWAIVFGNHDQEHFAKTHLGKDEIIEEYASYPCNLNVRGDTKIHGAGNDDLLVKNHAGSKPVFCAWLIDSGSYGPKGVSVYDWIHADQVNWYYRTSKALESKYGRKIPGLMFFHIPVQEFTQMWKSGKAKGDRYEHEGSSKIHSAIFAAVLERGDVKGIFCGHEHINNYVGEWKGIKLGYDAAIGYSEYNLPDSDPNHVRTRGGRVFLIKESDPWHFETWMRFLDGARGP
jgi:hypothetical protein